MTDVLLVIGAILAAVAALVHLGIFFLESVFWSRPAVWRLFGLRSAADAEVMRPMAYNQGFYNVFLSLGAGTGLVLLGSGVFVEGGIAITLFALLSMALAAFVLVVSNPRLWRAALVQGLAPLLGLAAVVLSVIASR